MRAEALACSFGSYPVKQCIVVQTHYSNINHFNNLWASIVGVQYEVVVVVNDCGSAPRAWQGDLAGLPGVVRVIAAPRDGHDPQVIQIMYESTDYDEWLLLHDTVVILNRELFDIVFRVHEGRSVSLLEGYGGFVGKYTRKDLLAFGYPVVHCKHAAVMQEITWCGGYHRCVSAATLCDMSVTVNEGPIVLYGRKCMKVSTPYFVKYGHAYCNPETWARPV